MKKILLSLMLIGAFTFGKAQVVFNEIYPNPDAGNNEYLELFNTAGTVNIGCYTVVSYDNLNHTAWVYRLPSYLLPAGEIVVLTSSTTNPLSINFKHQTNSPYTGTNILSWNAAGADLHQYSKVGSALVTPTDGPATDFLLDPSGGAGIALFLFDASGNLVNGFVGSDQAVLPSDFASLTTDLILPAAGTCDPVTLNFSEITPSETEFQNVISATGKDNGYYRTTNGLCGTWQKSSSQSEKTPGTSNGGTAAGSFATVTALTTCPTELFAPAIWNGSITIVNSIYLPATYEIWEDMDDDDVISAGDILKDGSTPNILGPITTTSTRNFGPLSLQNGHSLLVKVVANQNCVIFFRAYSNNCILLPVKFESFTANRSNSSSVAINWTTASEHNSKGFNIQRNVGGVWQTIAYVPSKAVNGTSVSDLTYSYTDANNEKGITQYRVQQVDLDGKFTYTDIRAIRGEGTVGKVIVYPNPSVDGKVNVVFEDNTAIRDVYVNDMQGRVVKSYKGITNNILVIERLTSGFYTIKITNRNTAASSVEKVVVK